MEIKSDCKPGFLHNFEISRDLPDALIEVCVRCGKKEVYFKDKDGNVNSRKYTENHIRDTLQPWGRTERQFYKEYGVKGQEGVERWKQHIEKSNNRLKLKKRRDELLERRKGKGPLIKRTGFQPLPNKNI